MPLIKNPKIRHDTAYYFEAAFVRVREKYPDAGEGSLTKRYSIGYWNDVEEFIDKECYVDYPGVIYPGPVRVSEERFIELIVEQTLAELEKKTQAAAADPDASVGVAKASTGASDEPSADTAVLDPEQLTD